MTDEKTEIVTQDNAEATVLQPESTQDELPQAPIPPAVAVVPGRISRLKTAFMYVLIVALVASALTAVIALLIGNEHSSAIAKSLLTIFVLFSHSLLILALLWADTKGQVGRHLLPTSILALIFANMITSMLGTWNIISADTSWRAFLFYFLVLGAVFVVLGAQKLRIAHTATETALNTTIGFIALTVISLVPWVMNWFTPLDSLYFRIVAALSILATTSYMITIVLRGIALGQAPELRATRPVGEPIPGGLMAIYITLGSMTAFVWCMGFFALLVSGITANSSTSTRSSQQKTQQYY